MVKHVVLITIYLFIFYEDFFARKLKQASFHSLIYIFEEEFRKKLSKNEKKLVSSPKIIEYVLPMPI